MNVETTSRRIDWFLKLFAGIGLLEPASFWLDQAQPVGKNRLVATLPPDAWLLLAVLMREEVYGPRGGGTAPAYKMSALQEVQAAVNRRQRHPALDGRAVEGVSTEILVCWRSGDKHSPSGEMRSPFRSLMPYQAQFEVLVPHYGSRVTTWTTSWDSIDLPGVLIHLTDEAQHLQFIRAHATA